LKGLFYFKISEIPILHLEQQSYIETTVKVQCNTEGPRGYYCFRGQTKVIYGFSTSLLFQPLISLSMSLTISS